MVMKGGVYFWLARRTFVSVVLLCAMPERTMKSKF